MKTILLGMALALSSSAFATVNDNDTLIVESPRQVKIITNTRVRDKKRLEKVGNLVKNSYLYR